VPDPSVAPVDIGKMIAAVAALGTAAYGLVDASKSTWGGGLSRAGFTYINTMISALFPPDTANKSLISFNAVVEELKASWLNGVALADQRSIAKTLIKLRLNESNAGSLAEKTGVDSILLTSVAKKLSTGESLTQPETDVFGRFDLILTTALDQAYQRADQRYRNWCKTAAVIVSIILAVIGGWSIHSNLSAYGFFRSNYFVQSFIIGLLATPLAPIAKDLSTAVQAASKAVQVFKK
jgi:hypothetical protein